MFKTSLFLLCAALYFSCKNNGNDVPIPEVEPPQITYDWKDVPVPAAAGSGKKWKLQSLSDDFNYQAEAKNKGPEFLKKWTDFYHNNWSGPGLTIWDRAHSLVADGRLQIPASRVAGTNKVNTGCITSTERVIYPVYIEARAKISNSTLASDVWLLSPDDTQEIDILEAYGSSYSAGAKKDLTWFAERIHISHHVFIRSPFQDYQPTDPGSWYYNGTLWRNDYHRFGVYWKDPLHLEYYIDGKLVRTVSGLETIDPKNFTGGTGLNKAMDIIINVEDQNWRSDQGYTPTDEELANREDHTFNVDWIRIYKPVDLQ
ncbi:agarase [Dyadobacter jejuensis]|uniref:Agarase n=1 Tax=Dyadobacter jejuensis TaxID=1082580 RepID=A0A316BDI8_9BACT|nr:family 16 glycosylhydrolase [Dyadobacter jejuensis]PWJ60557.1 agarase [Dyadobacter jejuensis]